MFIHKGGKNVGARIRSVFIPQDFLQTESEFREVFNISCLFDGNDDVDDL